MTKTRKTWIVVLVAVLMACVAMFTVTACKKKELSSVSVKTQPAKTEYIAGETFDPTGMVVVATYSDDSEQEITDYTYSPTTALATTNTTIEISYTEKDITKSCKLKITVTNKVTELVIKTMPTKTHYAVGETVDLTGMVCTATYQDGSSGDIAADKIVPPSDPLTADDTTVTVSFGGKEVSYPIVFAKSVVIKTAPTKTVYMLGEKFNPAGMVFTVTYADDYVEDVAVSGSVATYKTGILVATDGNIEIDYGGFKVTQPIEFAKGVFIEAEDGLLNGVAVPSTNKFTDARYVDDATPAEDLGASGTGAKAGVVPNTEENEKYIASGGVYVGDVKSGNTITFVFSSDKAGKGDIEFRMASQYLKQDSSWTPIWMGDCQFNKICEFSVNGVKYNIADSTILPGGGEEDGKPNSLLWYNWETVKFSNISFQAGRNNIELKFIAHDYTDCSQSGYNGAFTANIDSLIVTSAECEVEPLELVFDDYGYSASSVNLVKRGEEIYFVLEGEFVDNAYSGYTNDEIAKMICFDFQNNQGWGRTYFSDDRSITINGNNFVFEVRVTDLAVTSGAYLAHFGWQEGKAGQSVSNTTVLDLKVGDTITYPEETVVLNANYKTFTFAPLGDGDNEYSCVAIRITSSASIDEFVATGVKLEKDANDDVYFVINGTVKWTEYSNEDVAAYLNGALGFDFQGNLAVDGGSRIYIADQTTTVTATATGEGTFVTKIKVTAGNRLVANGKYSTHLNDYVTADSNGSNQSFDTLEANQVDTTTKIVIGHLTYQLLYYPEYSTRNSDAHAGDANKQDRIDHYYGCVGLYIESDQSLTVTAVSTDLETDANGVYFVIKGTYEAVNYTDAEVEEVLKTRYFDFQENPNAAGSGSSWNRVKFTCVKVVMANGQYSAYYDVTEIESYCWTNHYNVASTSEPTDFKPKEAYSKTVTYDGRKYELVVDPTDTGGAKFWGCAGLIVSAVEEDAAE